jgi:hypothetical protein
MVRKANEKSAELTVTDARHFQQQSKEVILCIVLHMTPLRFSAPLFDGLGRLPSLKVSLR